MCLVSILLWPAVPDSSVVEGQAHLEVHFEVDTWRGRTGSENFLGGGEYAENVASVWTWVDFTFRSRLMSFMQLSVGFARFALVVVLHSDIMNRKADSTSHSAARLKYSLSTCPIFI